MEKLFKHIKEFKLNHEGAYAINFAIGYLNQEAKEVSKKMYTASDIVKLLKIIESEDNDEIWVKC